MHIYIIKRDSFLFAEHSPRWYCMLFNRHFNEFCVRKMNKKKSSKGKIEQLHAWANREEIVLAANSLGFPALGFGAKELQISAKLEQING